MKKLIACALLALLAGCGSLRGVRDIETTAKPVEKVPFDIPRTPPLSVVSPKWYVVTPDNIEQVWKQLQAEGKDVVLFAVTDDGYKALSLTFSDVRGYIVIQRGIIDEMQQYYTSKDPVK